MNNNSNIGNEKEMDNFIYELINFVSLRKKYKDMTQHTYDNESVQELLNWAKENA